jgi:hypothetical protein
VDEEILVGEDVVETLEVDIKVGESRTNLRDVLEVQIAMC